MPRSQSPTAGVLDLDALTTPPPPAGPNRAGDRVLCIRHSVGGEYHVEVWAISKDEPRLGPEITRILEANMQKAEVYVDQTFADAYPNMHSFLVNATPASDTIAKFPGVSQAINAGAAFTGCVEFVHCC